MQLSVTNKQKSFKNYKKKYVKWLEVRMDENQTSRLCHRLLVLGLNFGWVIQTYAYTFI